MTQKNVFELEAEYQKGLKVGLTAGFDAGFKAGCDSLPTRKMYRGGIILALKQIYSADPAGCVKFLNAVEELVATEFTSLDMAEKVLNDTGIVLDPDILEMDQFELNE